MEWKTAAQSWAEAATAGQSATAAADATDHEITGLTNGTEYTVRVRAGNDAGDGPWSAEASETPIAGDTTAPTVDSATVSTDGVAIDIVFDEDLDVTGSAPTADAFEVTVDGGTAVNPASVAFHDSDADTVTLTMATADAIAAGETVSVDYTKPTADPLKDAADNEVAAFTGQAASNRLDAPAEVRAYAGNGRVDVEWDAPASGDAPSGYQVQWKAPSDTAYDATRSATVVAGVGEYAITGLTNGDPYMVQVRALDNSNDLVNDAAQSSEVTVGEPKAVVDLTAAARDEDFRVDWHAPDERGEGFAVDGNGDPVLVYRISWNLVGEDARVRCVSATAANRFKDGSSNPDNGGSYKIVVEARFETVPAVDPAVTACADQTGFGPVYHPPAYVTVNSADPGDEDDAALVAGLEAAVAALEDQQPWMRTVWDHLEDSPDTTVLAVDHPRDGPGFSHSYECTLSSTTFETDALDRCYSIRFHVDIDWDLMPDDEFEYLLARELGRAWFYNTDVHTTVQSRSAVGRALLYFSTQDFKDGDSKHVQCTFDTMADAIAHVAVGTPAAALDAYGATCFTDERAEPAALTEAVVRHALHPSGADPGGGDTESSWFTDTYATGAEAWAAVEAITPRTQGTEGAPLFPHSRSMVVTLLQDEFGGYCSPLVANGAAFGTGSFENVGDGNKVTDPWNTFGCEPGAPTGVTVSAPNAQKIISVAWTAPTKGGAPVTGYTVQWRTTTQTWADASSQTIGASPPEHQISVDPSERYVVRVRAVNSIGDGEWGAEVTSDAADDDANLTGLTVDGTSVEDFDKDTTEYSLSVAGTVTRVTFVATVSDGDASVAYTVDAASAADADSVTDGHQVDLDGGSNEVVITVTAQDGATTKAYTVTVHRAAVPHDWSLRPEGVPIGGMFRLLFVTSATRDGWGTDISAYDEHVQDALAADGGHEDIRDYSPRFKALAATRDGPDPRTHTGTHPVDDGIGVAIWWLNGPLAAADNDDFYEYDRASSSFCSRADDDDCYDGWAHSDPAYLESGEAKNFISSQAAGNNTSLYPNAFVWTGTGPNGERAASKHLGSSGGIQASTYGVPDDNESVWSEAFPGDEGIGLSLNTTLGLYGLSDTLYVEPPDAPYATVAAVTSTPANGTDYRAGETITATVTFSEDVTVMGTPQLPLRIGDVERDADYAAGDSSPTVLSFSYLVTDDDTDRDGISIDAFALKLNGGSIKREDTDVNAALTHTRVLAADDQRVNLRPLITGIEVTSSPKADPSNDTYGLGEDIEITVTFSEAVNVTGDVEFGLDAGGQKRARLKSGNGTTELVFAYTVQADDTDANGIWIGHPDHDTIPTFDLQMGQSVVGAVSGLRADLAHDEEGRQDDHKVDGSLTGADATLSSLTLSGITLVPAFAPGTTAYAATTSLSSTTVTIAISQGQNGANGRITAPNDADLNESGHQVTLAEDADTVITVTVTSSNRNSMRTYTVTVTRVAAVDSTAPEVSSATVSADGATIAIVFDEDLDATGTEPAASAFEVSVDGGTAVDPARVDFHTTDTNTITLTMKPVIAAGAAVSVAYDQPTSNALADAASNEVADFTQTAPNRPAAPVVTLTAGNGKLTATWTAPANGGSAITGYDVEWKTAAQTWAQAATAGQSDTAAADATTHDITSLTNNTEYTVRVRAANDAGDGPSSEEASETPESSIINVTAEFDEDAYTALEGRGAVTVTVNLSADPGRSVTIPITATGNGGADTSDYSRSATSVTINSGDTSATFTVTATDDDLYDGDGNGETLTLGFGSPLPSGVSPGAQSTATVGLIDNEVLMGSDAVPASLNVGDEFRLLFVTSGERDPASSDIADYNAFVQAAAAEGRAGIRAYSLQFRVLGSTADVSARGNTATHPDDDGPGEEIWWLNGPKAADDYGDFYNGSWDHRDPGRDEDGDAVNFSTTDNVYTGSRVNGTTSSSAPLGGDVVKVARPGSGAGNEIAYGNRADPGSRTEPFYGLSFVLHAVVPADTPYVTGVEVVSPPSGGEYFADDTIQVAVTFSEDVAVTGTPTFPLRIGSNTRAADYQEGESTASRLVFAYVVVADDSDDDGIASRGRILDVPAGAAITRPGGDMVAAYPAPINLDTQLKVIPAVAAEFAQASYTAAEGGSAVKVKVNLNLEPARRVDITISVTGNDGASDGDYTLSTTSLTFDADEKTASFTVSAAEDSDDDGGESLTLGFETLSNGVSPGDDDTATVILLNIPATVEVPADWDLIPSGVDTGDRFRLLFLTSERRDATSSNIATYNSFVRNAAANGHDDIQDYSDHFAALGSTRAVDARNNTGTHDRGVPIYWLNGPNAADHYGDFYDGSWDHPAPVRYESGEVGEVHSNRVWTGTGSDGRRARDGGNTLGSSQPEYGSPGLFDGEEIGGRTRNRDSDGHLYGLSFVFQVAPSNDAELSDLTVDGVSVAGFAADTTSYTHTLGNAAGQVTVVPVRSNDNATVAYSTTDADGNAAGHQMDLEVGNNEVTIDVTAQDGVATRTYTLTIVRTALEVEFAAASYTAAEGAGAVTVRVNLSSDPGRTVVLPISVTPKDGAGAGDYTLSANSLTFGSGDTSASFTVTAEDDDVLDGGVESLTLALDSLPDGWDPGAQTTTTVSLFDNEIPVTSDVVPFNVSIGDEFRLLFVTSGARDATSSNIADYNAFVQDAAAAGHAGIQDYSGQFRALASTADVDAIDNTATNYTTTDPGVRIWWLNSFLGAADHYVDFYDGSWDNRDPGRDENGVSVDFQQNASGRVWTGTSSDGEASQPLGSSVPGFAEPAQGEGRELALAGRSASNLYRLYGLSLVLHVVPPPDRPYVTRVETLDPPESGVYRSGDPIKVAVTFSEEVAVTGAPTFQMRIGSDTRQAAYQSGESTERRLVFTHAVTDDDYDSNGISRFSSYLRLPVGALITRQGDGSVAAYVGNIDWRPGLKVNEEPRITSIRFTSPPSASSSNPNYYGRGEDIEFTVTFSSPVRVTGDVTFRFVIVNDEPGARLVEGDGTNELVFVYTVQDGDRDFNGIAIFGSSDRRAPFRLEQGQSITDPVSGRDADLTHAAPNLVVFPFIDGNVTDADATLSALSLSDITLDPFFSSYVAQYTASAEAHIRSTTVTARPSQNAPVNAADVNIKPGDAFNFITGHQVALGTGDTVITVVVTSTNGNSMRTYTVTVTRADLRPPEASSAQVSADGTKIEIVFDGDLDTTGTEPAASAFDVSVDSGAAVNPASVTFHHTDADTVVLTMSPAIAAGGTVTVAYEQPTSNALSDAASNEVESFTGTDAIAASNRPGAPAVTLTAGDGQLTATWTAPANGGSTITGYTVEHKVTGAADSTYVAVTRGDAAALTETITGLTNDTGYTVRVRAGNDAGEGPWSAEASETPVTPLTAEFGADAYTAIEGRGAVTITVTLSADPESTVIIPITVTENGADDYSLSANSVTFNSGDTSATFTVTANDDDFYDGDGNDETITLSFGTLPSGVSPGAQPSTTVALVDNEILVSSDLVPSSFKVGDEFRLLFVTNNRRNGSSSDIAVYDAHIQTDISNNGSDDIKDYVELFRVLGSTAAVDARDHTGTTYTSADKGVPIWWVEGPKADDDYEDFYNSGWDHRDPGRYSDGDEHDFPDSSIDRRDGFVFTGTASDGTESDQFGDGNGLGRSYVGYGRPAAGAGFELETGTIRDGGERLRFYGLSHVLRAAAPADTPYVTGVELVDPPANGNYATGDTITVAVTFNEDVSVSGAGTPTFPLLIGSNTRQAQYQSAASTATRLVFTYDVLNDDSDRDGISNAERLLDVPSNAAITRRGDSMVEAYPGPITLITDLTVNVVTTPPTATGALVSPDGTSISLVFDKDLDASGSAPAADAFEVIVDGGTAVNPASVAFHATDSDTITLTMATADTIAAGATVTVDYTKPTTNPLKDAADNEVANFTQTAPNRPAAPVVTLTAGDEKLTATWSAPANGGSAITGYDVEWKTAAQTWAEAATAGQSATPAADATDHEITGLTNDTEHTVRVRAGNDAGDGPWSAEASETPVAADTTAPEVSSATVSTDGTAIDVVFDEDLDSTGSEPAVSAFEVSVDGTAFDPTGVAFHATDADTITLTMATADTIAAGATVTVDYTKPTTNPLKDAADNEVANFTGQAVANRAAADIEVSWAAESYAALEGHPGTTVTLVLSAVPTGDVTVPISASLGGGAEAADYSGVPTSVTFDSNSVLVDGLPTESFTVVATDDDFHDGDGNDETVTLSFGTPAGVTAGTPETATVGLIDNEVPATSDLIPDGTAIGEGFRLLFVTSNERDATSTDIDDYNRHVQSRAKNRGHDDIRPYSSQFQALASTEAVNARDNTATTGNGGEEIWWLGGPKAADHYRDFYDNTWDHQNPGREEDGDEVDFEDEDKVWTGTDKNGATRFPLGQNPSGFAEPFETAGELFQGGSTTRPRYPLYGLSYALYAAAPADTPSVTRVETVDLPDGPFRSGDTIKVRVIFSETVTVNGAPTFPMEIGSDTLQAEFQDSESTGTELVFTHLVTDADYDNSSAGVSNAELELELPSGTSITRAGGSTVAAYPGSIVWEPDRKVNPNPRLTDIEITSDPRSGSDSDTYGSREVIEFTVTFDVPVTVTGDATEGNITFRFFIGEGLYDQNERYAVLSTSDGTEQTEQLVFTYTVVSLDTPRDGGVVFVSPENHSDLLPFDLMGDQSIEGRLGRNAKLDTIKSKRTYPGHMVNGTLTPPSTDPPQNLRAYAGNGLIDMDWDEPSGGAPAGGYRVRFKKLDATGFADTDIFPVAKDTTEYNISGLTNGDEYTVQVASLDSASSEPDEWVKAEATVGRPKAVGDLTVQTRSQDFRLSWDAPDERGEGFLQDSANNPVLVYRVSWEETGQESDAVPYQTVCQTGTAAFDFHEYYDVEQSGNTITFKLRPPDDGEEYSFAVEARFQTGSEAVLENCHLQSGFGPEAETTETATEDAAMASEEDHVALRAALEAVVDDREENWPWLRTAWDHASAGTVQAADLDQGLARAMTGDRLHRRGATRPKTWAAARSASLTIDIDWDLLTRERFEYLAVHELAHVWTLVTDLHDQDTRGPVGRALLYFLGQEYEGDSVNDGSSAPRKRWRTLSPTWPRMSRPPTWPITATSASPTGVPSRTHDQ